MEAGWWWRKAHPGGEKPADQREKQAQVIRRIQLRSKGQVSQAHSFSHSFTHLVSQSVSPHAHQGLHLPLRIQRWETDTSPALRSAGWKRGAHCRPQSAVGSDRSKEGAHSGTLEVRASGRTSRMASWKSYSKLYPDNLLSALVRLPHQARRPEEWGHWQHSIPNTVPGSEQMSVKVCWSDE